MQYPNLLKRIIPFALTLGLSLFVASFFITLTPSFKRGDRGMRHSKWQCREEMQRVRAERDALRLELDRINANKWEEAEFHKIPFTPEELDSVTAAPAIPDAPPAPPRMKNKRGEARGYGRGEAYAPGVPVAPAQR